MKRLITQIIYAIFALFPLASSAQTTYVLDQELTWNQVKGGATSFALVSGNKVLYGSGNQNCGFADASTALVSTNAAITWKVESASNGTMFHAYKPDGTSYSIWGGSMLNSNPGGGTIFILGTSGSNNDTGDSWTGGQDMADGAIWIVTAVSGGYTIKNVGNDKYLAGTNATEAAVTWKFYSIKEEAREDFVFNGYDANSDYTLRPIRQFGKDFVYADDTSEKVTLHGVMDTPNWYFNNERWSLNWTTGQTYNCDADVTNCLGYFETLLSAFVDHQSGSYVDLFRLHLDPAWTNDPNKTATGDGSEADISRFSADRLRTYMQKLYWPIAKKAIDKGMYVIMRPPGVCPAEISVNGEYQQYLKTVWDIVSSDENVKKYAGQIMIELANEPRTVKGASGETYNPDSQYENQRNLHVLHDFFQPIVDVIRANGFKGVVLSSGSGYQSKYEGYATNPITGDNIGYAVHWYPGWMGTDISYDDETVRKQFLKQVPVVESRPIVVTEIDWSPADESAGQKKDSEGNLMYNEMGQPQYNNYGTWASGRTDQFGKVFKYTHDYYGNISMTLTHPYEYVDFDQLFNNGKVTYSFQSYAEPQQACAYTCFVDWYPSLYKDHTINKTSPAEDMCLKVTTTGAQTNAWDWQIRYPLPTALEEGKTYTIEMVAKAGAAVDIQPIAADNDSENKDEWGGSADIQYLSARITTDWSTVSFETNGNYPYDYLYFNIGKVNGDFMISNLKITEKSSGTVILDNNMNNNSTWTKTQSALVLATVPVTSDSSTSDPSYSDDPEEDHATPEVQPGSATPFKATERRPIDNRHPMWMIHVDVWNEADPQKIIDLIPDDIKPYVCLNLSLSCSYDTDLDIYRRPQNAILTYRSWASVCCKNNMWFTCQPASGGHTHLPDSDPNTLPTMESFFKDYKNFLGWNYAEQFWGFNEANDESSATDTERIKLFADLVPMHAKYGGFLTISFCGNIWSHPTNPIAMYKRNADLLNACKANPEAILWLYKYTTSANWNNNESVTLAPFISGLAKNYGVRYDNCGWNGAIKSDDGNSGFLKDDGKEHTYPGAVGIAPVLEQMTLNGACVWDGPELIWTEDFKNLPNSQTADGYTQRNWGTYPNFDNIWVDMFRKVLDGTIYIPTREEVIARNKVVIKNDVTVDQDATSLKIHAYASPIDLYHGLYLQDDPFNDPTSNEGGIGTINGYGNNNYLYFKKTGRYQAIPIVIDLYDDVAKTIPNVVKRSDINNKTVWATRQAKVDYFNNLYPEVSTGDLFVARNKNMLTCYYPFSYLKSENGVMKTSASASIPLKYNTCEKVELNFGKFSSALVHEYSDHLTFYFNNFRADTTEVKTDIVMVYGAKNRPTYTINVHDGITANASESWANGVYTFTLQHCGPVDVKINCAGNNTTNRETSMVANTAILSADIKQPEAYSGEVIIEAENMDYKNIQECIINQYYSSYQSMRGHSAMGFQRMGTNTSGALRWNGKLAKTGSHTVTIKYKSAEANSITASLNGSSSTLNLEDTGDEWGTVSFVARAAADNAFVLTNTGGKDFFVDQVTFSPQDIDLNAIGNAEYDAETGRYYFKTTYYAFFTSDMLSGKKVQDVAELIINCGDESTTGYRLDFEIFDADGKKVSEQENSGYVIGSESAGTRSTDPVYSKVYDIQELLASYIEQYPGCTFGNFRFNTAITDETKGGNKELFFTLEKVAPVESHATATVGLISKGLSEIPFCNWTEAGEQVRVNDHTFHFGEDVNLTAGDVNVYYLNYFDLTGYTRMVLKGSGTTRVMMNRLVDEGKVADGNLVETYVTLSEEGVTVDLTPYEFVHLNAIKAAYGSTATVTSVTLYNESSADYDLHGAGYEEQSFKDALADVSATTIDASDMINLVNHAYESANPNCLFFQTADNHLAGTQNLVTMGGSSYSANSISLYDGHAYRSPVDITSKASSYYRNLTTSWATVTLPFAVTMPEGVEAYVLKSVDGVNMTFSKLATGTEISALQPFVYCKPASGELTFTGTDIAKSISGYKMYPIEGLNDWYICQSMENNVIADVSADAYFKDFDVYAIDGDKFKHATKKFTTKPFRAFFLHKKNGTAAPAAFTIVVDDETTGIGNVGSENQNQKESVYNLNGQKVSSGYKGIVIKNGRAVLKK